MMVTRRSTMCLAGMLAIAAVSVSGQAPPPPQTYPIGPAGPVRRLVKRYIIGAAEKMASRALCDSSRRLRS